MTSKKKDIQRVLYVSEKAGFFGGVERYIYDSANAMKRAGWLVSMMYAEDALDVNIFLKLYNATLLFCR